MNKLDILSKLLAAENITLLEVAARTASFDINSRELRIPSNLKLTDEQKLLMVLHEVGHALFTTEKYIENIKSHNKPNFGGYMNVVEDARIERMIKNKFPGARKDFVFGYTAFHKEDFFGIASKDVNTLPLVDRINLHFKLGSRVGIEFTRDETQFVDEIEKAVSEEQVYDISKRLYEFAASNKDNAEFDDQEFSETDEPSDGEQIEGEDAGNETTGEQMEGEDDGNETTDDQNAQSNRSTKNDGIAPEGTTQDSFDESLQEKTCESSNIHTVDLTVLNSNRIVEHNEILKDLAEVPLTFFENAGYQQNKAKNSRIVDKMVVEFERKKSADLRRLTKVAKSGELDVAKLSDYKLVDDIFKRYNITSDAKNHGLVVLLDWSASMRGVMGSLINQTLILVEFCQRTSIKLDVYAFRDCDYYKNQSKEINTLPHGVVYRHGTVPVTLIRWFSSSMKKSETDLISKFLFSTCAKNKSNYFILPACMYEKYGLNATPLVVATLLLRDYIPSFKQKYNLQKITAIIITDGCDTGTYFAKRADSGLEFSNYQRNGFSHINVVDKVTNKTYKIRGSHTGMDIQNIAVLSIQDRYDYVTVIGMFIAPGKKSLTSYFGKKSGMSYQKCDDAWASVKKFGVAELPAVGYDKYFVIPCNDSDNDFDLSGVSSTMTSNQISKSFISANKTISKGKVLASKFIEAMA